MSHRSTMPSSDGHERERLNRYVDGPDFFPDHHEADVKAKLTRVQIEALVSGDFTPVRLGPELVRRLNHAWNSSGQRLHMLRVQVVEHVFRMALEHPWIEVERGLPRVPTRRRESGAEVDDRV